MILIHRTLLLIGLAFFVTLISCKDSSTNVGSEVTAEFTADATDILTGDSVTFEDQSSHNVTHRKWYFEGGSPDEADEQNPVVTYNSVGTFEVKLIVSNASTADEVVKSDYITVTESPQPVMADFSADEVSILSGESVTFTDESDGGPTEWAWEFIPESGSTITSTEQNPEIIFDNPSTYSVKLVASNSEFSDEELKENYITVIDASEVAADFSANTRTTYEGSEVNFTDESVGNATSWEWTFEGGTPSSSTEQNPTVTYSSAGKYKVTLTASNDSNTSTEEKTGYITIIPSGDLVAFLPFDGSSNDEGPLNLQVNNNDDLVTFDGIDRADRSNATAVFHGDGFLKIPAVEEKQLGTSAYSVGVWLKTDIPQQMWIWEEGGPQEAWFRINNNSTSSIYSFLPHIKGIVNISSDKGSILSDNVWHYVVCTRDETGTAKVYVDGTMIDERTTDIQDLTNNIGFIIGGRYNLADNNVNLYLYTGQLDDLVIYKRALSEEEITLLSGF